MTEEVNLGTAGAQRVGGRRQQQCDREICAAQPARV
jgi:hypothetical protein